ncbi:MAG TPA: glycoside hydrolase family 3 N-terminal domain-containing protein [Gammaproteobacteria bacterium]
MTAKKIIPAVFLLTIGSLSQAQEPGKNIYNGDWIDFNKNGKKDLYEDPSKPVEKRVRDLLAQMTLEEKTCQTATLYGYGRVLKDKQPTPEWKNEIWKDGIANIDEQLNGVQGHRTFIANEYTYPHSKHAEAINNIQRWFVEETRLGIPVDFSNEGIHGLTHDRATPLPAPIAIGSTWNKQLVYEAGTIVGREAKALGYTNIYAPILDVARDPRWGRTVETYGENPFHIAELGIRMAKGIQSQEVASTLKHFAVYGIPKGGRDGNVRTDPHVAPREMHELHLYPFRRVINEAQPMGIMSSYNDWNGEPVTASRHFLTELLRQQFGFKGYVVSDSGAVEFVHDKHKVAKDYKEAVRQVIEAGLNVRTHFTHPRDFILPLRELVREGKVSMKTLDSRVADVLRVKFELGLFDQPYVENIQKADEVLAPENTQDFVLEMAKQSLVLLKNKNNILPLNIDKIKNILVTGPLAAETDYVISRYGPSNIKVTSILEGIKEYAGRRASVSYAKGCEVVDGNWPESEIIDTPLTTEETAEISSAVKLARKADAIIAVMGENEFTVGESLSRTSLDLPGRQQQLLQALEATGKPLILVLVNGRPLSINWADKYIDGILETWFSNSRVGTAVAETIFGDYNPGGKLPITFPKTVGQIELNFPYKRGSQDNQIEGKDARVHGALYPFGFGLSYTMFEYSNLSVFPKEQRIGGNIEVTADVTNTGSRKGDEVVQLYLRDKVSSVVTYEYDLRGFERVTLGPGQTKTVKFIIRPDDMALLYKKNRWEVEPGEFEVMVGSSSNDIKLKGGYTIKK